MKATAVRAFLAYGLSLGFFACLAAVLFLPLNAVQMTLVGTMIGALLSAWKMPLSYFFDGLPEPERPRIFTPATLTTSPGDTNAPPQ